MGFAMAHYSMGFPMEHSKENCHCVFNQPGIFSALHLIAAIVFRLRFSFWYGNLKEAKKKLKVSEAVKMSFQELLSMRATKLSEQSNNQEQEELRREDEGE